MQPHISTAQDLTLDYFLFTLLGPGHSTPALPYHTVLANHLPTLLPIPILILFPFRHYAQSLLLSTP